MKKTISGFTLAEILISLLILGLGMVFVFNLFPLALQSLSYSHKVNAVSSLAEKKLDELKSQKEPIVLGQSSGREGDFNWTISAQNLTLGEGIDVTLVELDIDVDFKGKTEKQRFITYLPKNE